MRFFLISNFIKFYKTSFKSNHCFKSRFKSLFIHCFKLKIHTVLFQIQIQDINMSFKRVEAFIFLISCGQGRGKWGQRGDFSPIPFCPLQISPCHFQKDAFDLPLQSQKFDQNIRSIK